MANIGLNVNSKYYQQYQQSDNKQLSLNDSKQSASLFESARTQTADNDLNSLMYGKLEDSASENPYKKIDMGNNRGSLSFDTSKYAYTTDDKGVGHFTSADGKTNFMNVTTDKDGKITFDGGKDGLNNDLSMVKWTGTDAADNVAFSNLKGLKADTGAGNDKIQIDNVDKLSANAGDGDDQITMNNVKGSYIDGGDGVNTTKGTAVKSSIIVAGNKDIGSTAEIQGNDNALYGGLNGGDNLSVKGNENGIHTKAGENNVKFEGEGNFGFLFGSKNDNVANNGSNTGYLRAFTDKKYDSLTEANEAGTKALKNNQFEYFNSNGQYSNSFQQNNFFNNNNGWGQQNQILANQQQQLLQLQRAQIAGQALGNIGGMFGAMMFM